MSRPETLDASTAASAGLDSAKMPQHLAVIMDGNRRWPRERLGGP